MKKFIVCLIVFLSLAGMVGAVHDNGYSSSEYWVDVATDGFDDGYYTVVWSNNSGVYGSMYWVKNNTLARRIVVNDSGKAYWVAVASKKDELANLGSPNDNKYLVVWKDNSTGSNGYLYGRLYDYAGNALTGTIPIFTDSPVGNYVGASYGGGYFVVIFGRAWTGAASKLYYAVIGEDGAVIESGILFDGKSEYPDGGAIAYASLSYNPDLGIFGSAFRVSNGTSYGIGFLKFGLLSGGNLDASSVEYINVSLPTSPPAYYTSISRTPDGFLVAYGRGSNSQELNWYARPVFVSPDSISLGTNVQLLNGRNAGHADLAFIENGTNDYNVFVWEMRDDPDSNTEPFYLRLQKLHPDGSPMGDPMTVIRDATNSKRDPAVTGKPAASPETYIIAWIDDTLNIVQNSEYFSDLSEVSPTNEVPFLGETLLVLLAMGTFVILFRRH